MSQDAVVGRDPRLPASDEPLCEIARAVWAAMYPRRPWPARLTVRWEWNAFDTMKGTRRSDHPQGVSGVYTAGRSPSIVMSYRNLRFATPGWSKQAEDVLGTLVHELVHARHPDLGHRPPFDRLVATAMRRVWKAGA